MSLTEGESLFVGVHETGLNDLLTAFFQARPHRLRYATSSVVAGAPGFPTGWTVLQPVAFPGAAPLEYGVQFTIPQVDIFPGTGPLPPPLALGQNQFALRVGVVLALLCRRRRGDDDVAAAVIRTKLDVAAIGRFVRSGGPGSERVSVELLQVEIIDIAPESLEAMVECVVLTLLTAALGSFEVPIEQLPVPAAGVTITVARGPEAENDQFELYGTVA